MKNGEPVKDQKPKEKTSVRVHVALSDEFEQTQYHFSKDCKIYQRVEEVFRHSMDKTLAQSLQITSCELCNVTKNNNKNKKIKKEA